MTISNLYLSHQSYDWSKFANSKKTLKMLHKKIVDQIIESAEEYECYTSIEDVDLGQLDKIFTAAKSIYLVDLDYESLSKIKNLYSYTYWLNCLRSDEKFRTKINGLNFCSKIIENVNSLHTQRPMDSPVLWVTGCSVTSGVGVNNEQRFGYRIAEELKMHEVLLAKSGASIFWSADQILRSDVKKNDIVIWGITSMSRVNIAKQFDLNSVPITQYTTLPRNKQYWNIDYFDSPTQIVHNLRYILQVINYCQKIGASLYLINLLDPTWADLAFSDKINYINLTTKFNFKKNQFDYIDLGTDKVHPGPQQHAFYAQQILNFIKEN